MKGLFPTLSPSLMMFLGINIKGGGYMNSITDLLNLEDNDVIIINIDIQVQTKVLTLETPPTPHFCPVCGFKMYSRGVKQRTINHPILQDNYSLVLILKQ
jgi:hypothetical protein